MLKGLACPVGTVLAGSHQFIERAIRCRKVLGGAMRQSGILAAAGLWALKQNVDRLREDHEHTYMIAKGISILISILLNIWKFQSDRRKGQKFHNCWPKKYWDEYRLFWSRSQLDDCSRFGDSFGFCKYLIPLFDSLFLINGNLRRKGSSISITFNL